MEANGLRIVMVYKYLGMTQQQFAERLGYTTKQIQAYSKGANLSARFLHAMEETFPEININYIRNREENMLVSEVLQDSPVEYEPCDKCIEKERLITELENRLLDKEKVINLLEEKIEALQNKAPRDSTK